YPSERPAYVRHRTTTSSRGGLPALGFPASRADRLFHFRRQVHGIDHAVQHRLVLEARCRRRRILRNDSLLRRGRDRAVIEPHALQLLAIKPGTEYAGDLVVVEDAGV